MSNVTNIGKRANSLEKSNLYKPYSKVILTVSDDLEYTAGDDTGRTMEVTCPYGTAEMANRILSKIQGYTYQPYKASSSDLDPAAELGDGVTVGNLFGGLYSKSISFGPMYTADVSAPGEEKINYQYPYKSPEQRKITRNFKSIRTEFKVQSGLISAEVEARKSDVEKINSALKVQSESISAEVTARTGDVEKINAALKLQAESISAKVSKTGGDNASFGWQLEDDNWSVFANGQTVFKITQTEAEFAGKIIAKSGEIGGLKIDADALSTNGKTWTSEGPGIYLSPMGLKIGDGLIIDRNGNGDFAGSIRAKNVMWGTVATTDKDGNVVYFDAGHFNGGGLVDASVLGGKVGSYTLTTANMSAGINTSLGYADYAYNALNGWTNINLIKTNGIELGGHVLAFTAVNGTNVVTWH